MENDIKNNSELQIGRKKKCRELKFREKVLVKNDIPGESEWKTARLYGLKKIFPDIPVCGQSIMIVDCETGNTYDTHMDNNNEGLISSGLTDLWSYDNRSEKFHSGDIIGLVLEFDHERGALLYVCFRYQDIKNKKIKGDVKMVLTLVDEDDVQKGSVQPVPVVDARMVDNYERLALDGKLKIYRADLFASEVNYGSFSIPEDTRYQKVLDKWRDKKVTCGDLRTGWRKTDRNMRDQQNWINGLTDFWSQYPFLQDIADKYKRKGETDIIIGKKLFGIISKEGDVLEIVFTPELDEDKKPITEDKKPITEDKKPITEDKKPITEEKKPITEEKKPITEEKKKDSENEFVGVIYVNICALCHMISRKLFDNIYISLKTSQIIILGGTPGIGKNKIIEYIARLVCKNFKEQFYVLSIGPEHRNSTTVLYSFNVSTKKYEPTPLFNMIARALKYVDEHHFFIFDEGNVAVIEQYGAKILSMIETSKSLPIPVGYEIDTPYGKFIGSIEIPKNISFIFTVNMDETTKKLAPKTLSRAPFIDISEIDIPGFFDLVAKMEDSPLSEDVQGKFADFFKKYFVNDEIRKYDRDEAHRKSKIYRNWMTKNKNEFIYLHDINQLASNSAIREFAAYRMLLDNVRYMWFRELLGSEYLPENVAKDFFVIQDILPMLRFTEGSRPILKYLRELSVKEDLSMSIEKIDRMLKGLDEDDGTEFCR